MTPEEMDKKIEFILEMQAQFEANVGNLATNLTRSEANIDKLATNLARCEANIDNLRVSVADLAGVVRESIKISDDRFTRLDDRLSKLADAQKTTDERLNALISVVERHITGPDHVARP
jgi:chromosome segregation ATPase